MNKNTIHLWYSVKTPQGNFYPNLLPEALRPIYLQDQKQANQQAENFGYCVFDSHRMESVLESIDYPFVLHDLETEIPRESEENWYVINVSAFLEKSIIDDRVIFRLSSSLRNFLIKTPLKLIFFAPWEVTTFVSDLYNNSARILNVLIEELALSNIPQHKVFLMDANLANESAWSTFCKKYSLEKLLNIIPINFFEMHEAVCLPKFYQPSIPKIFSMKRERYFLCLNRNLRDFRAYVISELARRVSLQKGYVSLGLNDTFGLKDFSVISLKELFPVGLSPEERHVRGDSLKKILEKVPIILDGQESVLKNDRLTPEQAVEDCYFSIVTESNPFTSDTNPVLFITEKTYKAIYWLQPFIVVGSPGTLAYLRSLGYETYPEFFDEAYDVEPDLAKRLELVLQQVEKLCTLSLEELEILYNSVKEKLLRNQQLFLKRDKQKWVQEIINISPWVQLKAETFRYPSKLILGMTNQCNLSCLMCIHHYNKEVPRIDMTEHLFNNVLKIIPRISSIFWGGVGEPLMTPNILSRLRQIRKINPNIFIRMYTNGQLLSSYELIWQLLQNVDNLSISLNGVKHYERIMRGGSFKKIKDNLVKIGLVLSNLPRKVTVSLEFIVMSSTLDDIPRVVRLAHKHGISEVTYKALWVHWDKLEQESILMDPQAKQKAYKAIKKAVAYARDHGIVVSTKEVFPELDMGQAQEYSDYAQATVPCDYPWDSVQIGEDGRVLLCCNGQTVIGDLQKSTFEELWNNEEAQKYRSGLLEKKYYKDCAKCKIIYPNDPESYFRLN